MNLPDIRQLNIFIALEETRSFTAAARLCFITQSAVSHSIKALEKQLDCPLIERMGKRIILTPYGEVFLHHSKRVVAELESGLSKLEKLKQWGYTSIHVGVPDSICQIVLPAALKAFYEKHPRCEVSVSIGDTTEILKMIKDGQVDIGVGIQQSLPDQKFHFTPLADDELCFITSVEHAWTEQEPTMRKELSDVRLITYSAKSETKRLVTRHFNEHVIQHHQPLTLGNMEAIKEMTKLDMGVGIIPRWVAREEIEAGELTSHTISTPAPQRTWGVFSPAHKTLSLPEEDFISICKEHLEAAIAADVEEPVPAS
ncbi:LysR family transcriptional regulator [Verrucomicrobiaceae bacterium R5-34]|uniref:LysR family transcriptional regulator n=1 Tax=Oceaniferula flava TaxID=2800421 RepID=A0AAE2SDM8_9BACT|nr:LysR family transcriptional regulator [Oceaniferula flavus]MBK1831316.1 LysR family transcriptional regulator [Verrucomicrobiaceae bacterium R5-34]MBK1855487.1 LysR family transcriptional regulator [Oceaniferula flavus]MBM1136793.1 LysR family transcriptional regulator [Oceaniferula flavus]